MKKLSIWLPDDHPLFAETPGSRSEKARFLLEIGMRFEKVQEILSEQIDSLSQKIDSLIVSGLSIQTEGDKPEDSQVPDNTLIIDLLGSLSSFE